MAQVLAKSSTSISMQVPKVDGATQYRLAYSQSGYVYYSWTTIDSDSPTFLVKGLEENTHYVFKNAYFITEWSEYGPLTPYIRTFTQEESTKRVSTVLEHALKLEKAHRTTMEQQIHKLEGMLKDSSSLKRSTIVQDQDNLLRDRSAQDAMISNLQKELERNACQLSTLEEQHVAHEKLIEELLREAEECRKQEGTEWKRKAEQHQERIAHMQAERQAEQLEIQRYKTLLAQKREEISGKESQVERIMEDCRRLVQEHADTAHAKQLQMEEALQEAKSSLESQAQMNALLRDELAHLGSEYQQALQTIDQLRAQLAALT